MNLNQINFFSAVIGFSLANIVFYLFSGRTEGENSSKSLLINIGSFTIHLHHWIIGLMLLFILLAIERYFGRNIFISLFKGVAFGAIFHGISYYNDYLKIIK